MSAGVVWEEQSVPVTYKVADRDGCDRVLQYLYIYQPNYTASRVQ